MNFDVITAAAAAAASAGVMAILATSIQQIARGWAIGFTAFSSRQYLLHI